MATKILLVDDSESMQRLYERAFQQAQFDVAIASDGLSIVQRVQVEQPQAIVMDVMMPGRNGMEALGDLMAEESTKNIPVIMLSANEDDQLMLQSMELGAKRYLVKSMMEPDQIVTIVAEVITESLSKS